MNDADPLREKKISNLFILVAKIFLNFKYGLEDDCEDW